MTATDRDSGVNGELVYKVSDDHFTIETQYIDNQYVGHIKVAKYVVLYLSHLVGKPTMWFLNGSDTNQAVQSQKQARSLKFRI